MAARMLAIAGALEGMSRAEAARLAGWSGRRCATQWSATTPRGWTACATGRNRGRIPTLTEAEQALLLDTVFRGPDRTEDGGSDWTLPMLCRWVERRFDKRLHPASLSRQKTRPLHPMADEKAKAAFVKGASRRAYGGGRTPC
jgi:transposase